ncbi:MAG: NYN domain-containing protein [Gammaproteobacteria bacterium]|nr:NYN domain-containing protein [Gammaproteobacteria bacterium]
MAVRLGEVRREVERSWTLKPESQKALLSGRREVAELTDEDFVLAIRQKGVDMRIGLDIASLSLKRQADTIVLVAGDADFVSAAKLARREGVRFVLDPLWQNVPADLNEHIDGLTSGFPKPR